MRGSLHRRLGVWIAPGLVGLAIVPSSARGDDGGGFFGRLFRLGGNQSSSAPGDSQSPRQPGESQHGAYESAFGDIGSGGSSSTPANRPSRLPADSANAGPISTEGPSTPDFGRNEAQPRLSPRSRVAAAVTAADPLLTRMALGRSNDGSHFGMFLQIFADGTVIDSEGVHRLSQSDIRPIAEAIQSGEVGRLRGHCGTPSNDFIEYVHVVVFERRMGRLQAHSFSYGGNPQGCDAGIRHLHGILESLQSKLSRTQAASAVPAAEESAPAPSAAARSSAAPPAPAAVIPLTPLGSR
jgi:hypothetical protein